MKRTAFRPYRSYRRPEEPYRVNRKIVAREVRVVDADRTSAVYTLERALALADQRGLDLVEIAPKASPPVCSIVDYAKFKYDQKKKEKQAKAKASKVVKKEIKLTLRTEGHDLAFKKEHAIKFLGEGATVVVSVRFRHRELQRKEEGKVALEEFFQELVPHGAVQKSPPKIAGRGCTMTLQQKKKH